MYVTLGGSQYSVHLIESSDVKYSILLVRSDLRPQKGIWKIRLSLIQVSRRISAETAAWRRRIQPLDEGVDYLGGGVNHRVVLPIGVTDPYIFVRANSAKQQITNNTHFAENCFSMDFTRTLRTTLEQTWSAIVVTFSSLMFLTISSWRSFSHITLATTLVEVLIVRKRSLRK